MKFVLVALVAILSTSAFAQKHMVNFDAGEIAGALKWTTGSNQSETRERAVTLNYAYTLLSKLQVGGKANYTSNGDESYGFQVGAIYNLSSEIRSSIYGSAYVGMNWGSTTQEEARNATLAIGKRMPLSFINNENFVYSPEVAWTTETSTKGDGYTQGVAVKFLNFSLFF